MDVNTEYDLKGAIDFEGILQGLTRENSVPALHGAIQAGNLRTLMTMINTGLNMELPLSSNLTLIWMAVILQQPLIVAALCAHGADANAILTGENYALQPLHFVCASGFTEIPLVENLGKLPVECRTSLSNDDKERPRNDLCHALIIFGNADVNGVDFRGMTPILWCCKRGLLNTAKVLIYEKGTTIFGDAESNAQQQAAGLELCNTNGFSALHHAILSGNNQLVQLCLDHRPSVLERKTVAGQTPFELAQVHGLSDEILRSLREGCDGFDQNEPWLCIIQLTLMFFMSSFMECIKLGIIGEGGSCEFFFPGSNLPLYTVGHGACVVASPAVLDGTCPAIKG